MSPELVAETARDMSPTSTKGPKMSVDALARLRAICLALPEATEKLTWEETPTFRVRDKIFAMYSTDHHDGRVSMWCKAPPGAQEALVGSDPERFFVPPYVGRNGWIGVDLRIYREAAAGAESRRRTPPGRTGTTRQKTQVSYRGRTPRRREARRSQGRNRSPGRRDAAAAVVTRTAAGRSGARRS